MYDCRYMDCVEICKILLFHIMPYTKLRVVFFHNLNNLELLMQSLQQVIISRMLLMRSCVF